MEINNNYKLLIASTSTVHGSGYLEYIIDNAVRFLGVDEIIFIPYARPSGVTYDDYTEAPRKAFFAKGIRVKGLHEFNNPKEALLNAKAIFTGGGNTFLLLKTLYELDLISTLREVIGKGIPYMGSSAGSNITGLTIGTTNDMPIVYPPSFEALEFLPFNLNPHYLDPDPNSTHKGETRETRIKEFHKFNSQPVLGLREGSWLEVQNGNIELKGNLTARLFQQGKEAVEIENGLLIIG
ncbi:dipeptidase PepE [Moheibacter sediminis]|uniref:dipeptidase E n=1 Tax=Moheibacter sediminis TaxID=1434700 RepID=A0A1W1Z6M8_9FLAO|nr:dipeptidase PepE [Moheibacter sediminis]SMC43962.1 dipeptidase E [Moheibacter sediminis]